MPIDFFDRAGAEDRRDRVAAAQVENERMRALEAEADAERRESLRVFTLRGNAAALREQYLAAGVEPALVNGEGVPRCSLSLLLLIGWTIREEELGGGEVRRTLVRPTSARSTRRPWGMNDEGS